ncbi:hypothetical protein PM10SUCC1_01170 [Propionigenium maris DSM 9537]|uniref:DinB-like domain-containing protein n=1 Tax=Propionigenium maris DSM 9537 TaxID=1123000 RepID=A0A9W6LLE6_9FUSO|nr:DinB family protein [Propionigenium maris]GLI54602.1 hypothetical protein PM10SUCC1_01170 [Propionigenium maris DSM 9537]
MKREVMGLGIKLYFNLSNRERVVDKIKMYQKRYMELVERICGEGRKKIHVPSMVGIDEDMRDWSLYMILEHNARVNKTIKNIVYRLSRGEELRPEERIDPKTDVMPEDSGMEQVDEFRRSIEEYLQAVEKVGQLKGTRKIEHPVFGAFDAHQWHCMFAFHLGIHLRQAEYIAKAIRDDIENMKC